MATLPKSKFIVEILASLVILALVIIGFAMQDKLTIIILVGIVAVIQLLHALFWRTKHRGNASP